MASVWVTEEECARGDFPPVCVVCGDEADRVVEKNFRWHPPWLVVLVLLGLIGIIVYAVLASALGKSMKFPAPLCHRHGGHWRNHSIAVWGWLAAVVAVLGAGLALLGDQANADLGFALRVGAGGLFLVGLIVVAVWQRALVRAVLITDDDMRLSGISRAFADAVKDERRAEREERRARRRRDDDDPPRRRRAGDDDEDEDR